MKKLLYIGIIIASALIGFFVTKKIIAPGPPPIKPEYVFTLADSNPSLSVNQNREFTFTSNCNVQGIKLRSSDERVVSNVEVKDSNSLVVYAGNMAGTATITVIMDDGQDFSKTEKNIIVEVLPDKPDPNSVPQYTFELANKNPSLEVNQSSMFTFTSNCSGRGMQFRSSNKSIISDVKVKDDSNLVIYAGNTAGIATITVTMDDDQPFSKVSQTFNVKVNDGKKTGPPVKITPQEVKNLIVNGGYERDTRLSKKYGIEYVDISDDDFDNLQQNFTFVQQQIEFENWRDFEVLDLGFDEQGKVNSVQIRPIY